MDQNFTPPQAFTSEKAKNFITHFSKTLLAVLLLLSTAAVPLQAQDAPFITVWKTDNLGASADNQIIIPGTGTNYTVEWEEIGNVINSGSEIFTDADTITFPSIGTYRVKISGDLKQIAFNNSGDKNKIIDIDQWGDINWLSFENAFKGCSYLTSSATDTPNLAGVTSLSGMFESASLFNSNINNWDVNTITDMSYMFRFANSFNQDLNNWNVSNADLMYFMFANTNSFNGDITSWNVANARSLSYMFSSAIAFNQDISNWDVGSALYMRFMFTNARKFSYDISNWNVSSVELFNYMFYNAQAFNYSLGGWDISSATNMTNMFDNSGLSYENYESTLIGWSNLSTVPANMSLGAVGLNYCDNTGREFLINSKGWTITGDELYCGAPFVTIWKTDNDGSSENNQISIPGIGTDYFIKWEEVGNEDKNNGSETGNNFHTLNFPQAGTYRVKINGNFTRIYFSNLGDKSKILDIENWGDIQWTSMNTAFAGANNLTISAIDAPDLSQVTDMTRMFYEATSFNQDISNWDVSTVINMSDLFHGASSFNQDLSSWNVSNVTKMTRMFARTAAFNQNLNSWNTANVEQMDYMFWDADAFNSTISDWNTTKVNNMWGMFYSADSFNIDISTWDVSAVTNMWEMFREASSFNQDVSSWNVSNVTDMSGMFYEATAFDQNLGGWNLTIVNSLFEFLTNSGLSAANYDLSLEGWATGGKIPSDIALSVEGLNYCASVEYRQQLIDNFGWGIMGDETCSLAMEGTYPAAEATSVEKETEIYLTFDQEILEIDFSGIKVTDISGTEIPLSEIYIDSLTLYLVHNGLGSNTYQIEVPENSIISVTGKTNDVISWSFTTQTILSSQEEEKATAHYIYPNPFSKHASISFSLDQQSDVQIRIMNPAGKLVQELNAGTLNSGQQEVQIDRGQLPAGMYFYHITTGSGKLTGKMMIK